MASNIDGLPTTLWVDQQAYLFMVIYFIGATKVYAGSLLMAALVRKIYGVVSSQIVNILVCSIQRDHNIQTSD